MNKFREILKEKFFIFLTAGGGDGYEPPPGIEIIPSWSAKRKIRQFLRNMDKTYENMCRLETLKEIKTSRLPLIKNIIEEEKSTESMMRIISVPVPPQNQDTVGGGCEL